MVDAFAMQKKILEFHRQERRSQVQLFRLKSRKVRQAVKYIGWRAEDSFKKKTHLGSNTINRSNGYKIIQSIFFSSYSITGTALGSVDRAKNKINRFSWNLYSTSKDSQQISIKKDNFSYYDENKTGQCNRVTGMGLLYFRLEQSGKVLCGGDM